MISIRFTFPGGFYHATPRGRHVNEGAIEWPPSPWRILRALLATGFSKKRWEETVPEEAETLINTLAGVLPRYKLPHGALMHTRHYMPKFKYGDTTLVLDARVRVGDNAIVTVWDVELPNLQYRLLQSLLDDMSYLGRAESWVDATLSRNGDDAGGAGEEWCVPCPEHAAPPAAGFEQVRVLCPIPPEEYTAWSGRQREQAVQDAQRLFEASGKKISKARRKKEVGKYPTTLLDCLLTDTGVFRKMGWSRTPGTRDVLYWTPTDLLETSFDRIVQTRARHPEKVDAVLLALSSDTSRGDVLPSIVRCLPQAEMLHNAIVSSMARKNRFLPELVGRDKLGKPLSEHRHVHYIPLSLGRSGRLDHVLVWAPAGLGPDARGVIRSVRKTWMKGSDKDIFVTVAGSGPLKRFKRQMHATNLLGPATHWVSHTPFIAPRFIKKKKHTIEDQIRAELASRSLPEPERVEVLDKTEMLRRDFLKFVVKRREGKPQPPTTTPLAIRIIFPEPVSGPILLGYASHFGLGLFHAESKPEHA